jgi:hypothetical protein
MDAYKVKVLSGFCPKRGITFVVDVKNNSRLLVFKGDEHLPEYEDKDREDIDFQIVRLEGKKAYQITITELGTVEKEDGATKTK